MKRKTGRALSSGDILAYSTAAAISRQIADDQPYDTHVSVNLPNQLASFEFATVLTFFPLFLSLI